MQKVLSNPLIPHLRVQILMQGKWSKGQKKMDVSNNRSRLTSSYHRTKICFISNSFAKLAVFHTAFFPNERHLNYSAAWRWYLNILQIVARSRQGKGERAKGSRQNKWCVNLQLLVVSKRHFCFVINTCFSHVHIQKPNCERNPVRVPGVKMSWQAFASRAMQVGDRLFCFFILATINCT